MKHIAGGNCTEVTGVIHILERSKFLSVGWNRRITTYPDQPDVRVCSINIYMVECKYLIETSITEMYYELSIP